MKIYKIYKLYDYLDNAPYIARTYDDSWLHVHTGIMWYVYFKSVSDEFGSFRLNLNYESI